MPISEVAFKLKTSIDESKMKERKNIKISFKMPIKKIVQKQPE